MTDARRMWAERKCACVDPSARRCLQLRSGLDFDDYENAVNDEDCSCLCHEELAAAERDEEDAEAAA